MLSLVKVDHIRDELLCIRVVLSGSLRIDFRHRLTLAFFSRGLTLGVFSLCGSSCSLFFLLTLALLLFLFQALLLFFVDLLFFLFFFAFLLDQLRVVLDAL